MADGLEPPAQRRWCWCRWVLTLRPPTTPQFVVLFLYGTVQMGLAYWLMAKGLRSVTPQEAGTISLLEPLLNPVWAYLVSPATEPPGWFTLVGGGVILAALAWRYWPRRKHQAADGVAPC